MTPTNVAPFTGDTSKAREHLTVPVEEFAAGLAGLLADSEDKGSRAVLLALGVPLSEHAEFITEMSESYERRARLYAAQIRLLLRGIAV